ncbi:MAG: copper resistance protein NlpE N-terminal domain-containing protein [Bacteroidaceae bacterium]|nr:copper resistance protein NlpE N-terminal domain-containing protein [Bacteroidaceae bacterium]
MKKVIILSATALSILLSSCNSCGSCNSQPQGVVVESDSIFMVNDSTIGDLQTYTFEGTVPMNNGNIGNVLLTIQTLSLNDDGTYTITTNYIDEAIAAETDKGEVLVMIGIPNDSTAVVYEFVSETGKPKMNFKLSADTSLVKLDKNMQPASKNQAHKLTRKK